MKHYITRLSQKLAAYTKHALFGATLVAASVSVAVQAKAVDFSGKTVEIIVPYTEGGGTDVYVRLFAPYLQKYLPGNPSVIIRNFPGGASIMGSNRFEARAKPDGLSIIATSSSTSVAQLLAAPQREFDLLGWRQIVASALGTVVYFAPHVGIDGKDIAKDVRSLIDNETLLLYGAKQPDAAELRIIMALDLLGLKFDAIFGVARGEVREAMLRGEMAVNDDTSGAFIDRVMPYVKRGELVPMFTFGYVEDGQIGRDPVFPDLPWIGELYEQVHGEPPSGDMWNAVEAFIYLAQIAAKGLALPAGTPDDIRDVYVKAVEQTIADEEFQARAKEIQGDYPHFLGEDADNAVRRAVSLDPETEAFLKNYLRERYNIQI
ncbi:tricarboxylate transporter [Pseudochelatococcus sp. B33]